MDLQHLNRRLLFSLLLLAVLWPLGSFAAATSDPPTTASFPPPVEAYGDAGMPSVGAKLIHRAQAEPFNVIASLIFLAAIVHTFMVAKFRARAHRLEHEMEAIEASGNPIDAATARRLDKLHFRAVVFHFLGEVEAVFGIWLIPLFLTITGLKSFTTAVNYLDNVNFSEAIFVTVIMSIAASRPVIVFAERCLAIVARALGDTPLAWWLAILTAGPLLGSFITEPAAMTLCALLLGRRFYAVQPSNRLKYGTLGLLFTNISVGGTLTHFAAPPVVMVAGRWGFDLPFMFQNFGWKAIIGILIANAVYWAVFRRELANLQHPATTGEERRAVPLVPTLTHLLFLAWTVLNAHHPSLVVIGFLFFMAYHAATERHQDAAVIRGPLLVGFFLAALVIHGGCQQWWIEPVLGSLGKWPLMIGSVGLTAFNDNAAITYLASLVPDLSHELRYSVLAGAVTGGGLTVIANAPNPAGQTLLQEHFGENGIAPGKLFVAALTPTVIVGAALMLLP